MTGAESVQPRYLVLLHAFPLDRTIWDDVVEPVADAGWEVVVPDLRGFGRSRYGADGPDDEPSLTAMARDVLAILDRVGAASAVLGGVSMGGYVAMEVLRQAPHRVAGLVLGDTKAGADTEPVRANRLTVAEQVLAAGNTDALARSMGPTLLGTTSQAQRPEVVARVRALVEAADPAAVAWAQRAMAARPDSLPTLAAFTRPTLVFWGEDDVTSPRADQDLMLAVLPDARLRVVTRAGHLAVLEDPTQVTAALLEFLAEPALTRPGTG